jgi:hypothetical protein
MEGEKYTHCNQLCSIAEDRAEADPIRLLLKMM